MEFDKHLNRPAAKQSVKFQLMPGEDVNMILQIILGMGSTNERQHYIVASFLTGWANAQNDPWILWLQDHTRISWKDVLLFSW